MEERLNAKYAAAREERKRVSSEWSVEYARKEAPYLAAVRETNRLARERCAQDRCDQARRARRDQQRHDQERRDDQERRGYQERRATCRVGRRRRTPRRQGTPRRQRHRRQSVAEPVAQSRQSPRQGGTAGARCSACPLPGSVQRVEHRRRSQAPAFLRRVARILHRPGPLERGAAACRPAPTPKHAQCAEPALAPLSCYKLNLLASSRGHQHTNTHSKSLHTSRVYPR
jgi:hypothetical protein